MAYLVRSRWTVRACMRRLQCLVLSQCCCRRRTALKYSFHCSELPGNLERSIQRPELSPGAANTSSLKHLSATVMRCDTHATYVRTYIHTYGNELII